MDVAVKLFALLALRLTNFENHRTQTTFVNRFILKVRRFQYFYEYLVNDITVMIISIMLICIYAYLYYLCLFKLFMLICIIYAYLYYLCLFILFMLIYFNYAYLYYLIKYFEFFLIDLS